MEEQKAESDAVTLGRRRSKIIWACVPKTSQQTVDVPVTEASGSNSYSSRRFMKVFQLYEFISHFVLLFFYILMLVFGLKLESRDTLSHICLIVLFAALS